MKISARDAILPVLVAGGLVAGTVAATATADDIVLKSSKPENRAVLRKVPTSIRLTFSVKPSKPEMNVISPDGDNHARSVRVSGRTVIAGMRGHEKGRYRVTYKVSSPDGDAKRGSISFRVR